LNFHPCFLLSPIRSTCTVVINLRLSAFQFGTQSSKVTSNETQDTYFPHGQSRRNSVLLQVPSLNRPIHDGISSESLQATTIVLSLRNLDAYADPVNRVRDVHNGFLCFSTRQRCPRTILNKAKNGNTFPSSARSSFWSAVMESSPFLRSRRSLEIVSSNS
jgi:hypothetical protein